MDRIIFNMELEKWIDTAQSFSDYDYQELRKIFDSAIQQERNRVCGVVKQKEREKKYKPSDKGYGTALVNGYNQGIETLSSDIIRAIKGEV